MSVPVHCPACGYSFKSRGFHIVGNVQLTVINGKEQCPRCGTLANMQDGTYNFVGSVMSAFRGSSIESVRQFESIAKAAAAGSITLADAQREAAKVHASFGEIIRVAMQWGVPALLVAVVALYLQWVAYQSDNADSAEIIRQLQQQNATNELVLGQLQKLSEAPSTPPPPVYSAPKQPTIQPAPKDLVHTRPNRKERRKAASLAPKKP